MAKKKQKGNGTGTVYPRKNKNGKIIRYRGCYFVNGKRHYVSAQKKTDAERALRQAMSDVDRGLTFDAGTLTLGEFLDAWLTDYLEPLVNQGRLEHSTYICDAGIVRNHIKPYLGRKKLKDLNRAEVRRL